MGITGVNSFLCAVSGCISIHKVSRWSTFTHIRWGREQWDRHLYHSAQCTFMYKWLQMTKWLQNSIPLYCYSMCSSSHRYQLNNPIHNFSGVTHLPEVQCIDLMPILNSLHMHSGCPSETDSDPSYSSSSGETETEGDALIIPLSPLTTPSTPPVLCLVLATDGVW